MQNEHENTVYGSIHGQREEAADWRGEEREVSRVAHLIFHKEARDSVRDVAGVVLDDESIRVLSDLSNTSSVSERARLT